MNRILEQLYNGTLNPYVQFNPAIERFQTRRTEVGQFSSQFLEKLPPEFKEEFSAVIDSYSNLLSEELEHNYMAGFRTGVRMMTEVYFDPADDPIAP